MNGAATHAEQAVHQHLPLDNKIDPSIATAITTGSQDQTDGAPAYTAQAPTGVPSSGATQAAPEKGGLHPGALGNASGSGSEHAPQTTTTTTTIM